MTHEEDRTPCPADSRGLCAPPYCDGYLSRASSAVHPMLRTDPESMKAWREFLSAVDDGDMAADDLDAAIGRLQELARSEGYSDGFGKGWDARGKADALSAQRGGEAVDREGLVSVAEVVAEAERRYRLPQGKVIGDGTPEGIAQVAFRDGAAFALAARGDAAPTVITDRQELDACRAADQAHGLTMGAGEAWRHAYLAALGIEVR